MIKGVISMSRIYAVVVILILSGQASFLFAGETPDANDGGGIFPLASGTYSGFEETTYGEPNWVLVLSDHILREDICVASDTEFPYDWYEKVFNPCYWSGGKPSKSRYWSLESCAETGQAFPLAEISNPYWTTDSLYV
jgi:hypothetical protein